MLHHAAPISGAERRAPVLGASSFAGSAGLAFLLLAAPSVSLAQVAVSVVASDDTASETPADNGEFIVRSSGLLILPITIDYSVTGSASAGDDYAPLSGSVTLGPLQPQASIAVEIQGDDGVFEGDETVTIQLSEEDAGGGDGDDGDGDGDGDGDDDDGGIVITEGTATITIIDSPHSVTASTGSNAGENPPAAGQINVSLGARNDSGDGLGVQYSVAGSATASIDYVALSGVAVIAAGSSSTTIDVTPLDDDLQEGDETVEITITGTSDNRVSVGTPATAALSIADDDEGGGDDGGDGEGDDDGDGDGEDDDNAEVSVSVSAVDDTAGETPADSAEFVVSRVGGHPTRPVTIGYSVSGSAAPGDDYAPLSGSVRLDSQAESAPIAVNVAGEDDAFEGDETVTISLQEEDGDVAVENGTATVTILDSAHSVSASRISNASENPPATGQIQVSLGARNDSGDALIVEYSVAGTATSGTDYTALSGVVEIPAGSSTATVDIVPVDDAVPEGDETVQITLTQTSDPAAPAGEPATASLTITDNDPEDNEDDADDDGGSDGGDGGGGGPADDPAGDSDNDGLSNEEEEELGTDSEVADTDSDGVDDGDEVAAGTDPLDDLSYADVDGDFVPDAVEAADGTDPNDPQSFADGDGAGTSDHMETTIFASFGIPPTSIADPNDDGRDLDDDGLPDRLEILIGSTPDAADSPTANGAGDDDGNGITNAVDEYLASLRIGAADAVSDRDRDGYPDAAEVALGLNPLRASEPDSDGDGVPDIVEARAGLDLDAATDSDGDGVPEARELALGTDPLDANSPIPNGAMDDDADGVSNAIEEVLQVLGVSDDIDESADGDGDGISDADEIRFGTDPFRDEQPAPWIELRQAGIGAVNALDIGGDTATATAVVGGHQAGAFGYDWSASDNALLAVSSGGRTNRTLTLSPQTLPPGPYRLVVSVERTVGDYRSPVSTVQFIVSVLAEAGAAEIADADSDGVADFADDADARSGFGNELQVQNGARMQAEAGVHLQLGSTARTARTGSARVTQEDIANNGDGSGSSVGNSDDDFDYVSGIFDFEITNLPEAGSTVQIVIPQAMAIGEFPEYRKFQPDAGWVGFVENDNNSIATAAGSDGACPAPGDDSYRPGIAPGHLCIQLGIEDGGPNDGDAARGPNGVIKDPGGAATPKGQVTVGQGGGGVSPVTLLLGGGFAWLALQRRRCAVRRKPAIH